MKLNSKISCPSNIIKIKNINAAQVAHTLKSGKIVALATDTVYGMCCDLDHESWRLNAVKRRDSQKPLGVFLPSIDLISE